MIETPECDKLHEVAEDSNKIGEFLEWLQGERQCVIAEYTGNPDLCGQYELFPVKESIVQLLAQFYDIDLEKVEKEKQAILELQQELNWSWKLLESLS